MTAIHSLSDNLQGILVDLSEKIDKLEDKNTALEERTKELETKETELTAKQDELIADNVALQERVSLLEQQINADADSKLKELLVNRQDLLDNRVSASEDKLLNQDKLVDRLENCEKKLASFYGDDTNILGRVGFLETRFRDFKENEDSKMERFNEELGSCNSKNVDLSRHIEALEEGLGVAQRLMDILHESKLDKSDIDSILSAFKTDNRLLDDGSIVEVTETANDNKDKLSQLLQAEQERCEEMKASFDKIREDIETLQQNTEPAHRYECFGSDQAVKIFQIETKLKELEGLSTDSIDGRLAQMDDRIGVTSSQMDRVLKIESFISSNFDRIGTDYVHLSRLISEINEELHGNEQNLKDIVSKVENIDRNPYHQPVALGGGVDDGKLATLNENFDKLEKMIVSADNRLATLAEECKKNLLELQTHSDKKIDILAVWVSKNINLLASSTRKKFKQLLAGDDWALLSGQSNRAGHCLSCNQSKRPNSANPKTRVTKGKNPIFKITHVEDPPTTDSHNNNSNTYPSILSDSTDDAMPAFKMTVPASLRTKISEARQSEHVNELFNNHEG